MFMSKYSQNKMNTCCKNKEFNKLTLNHKKNNNNEINQSIKSYFKFQHF